MWGPGVPLFEALSSQKEILMGLAQCKYILLLRHFELTLDFA